MSRFKDEGLPWQEAGVHSAGNGALHGRQALPQEWIAGLLGRPGERDDDRVFELIAEARERFWDR